MSQLSFSQRMQIAEGIRSKQTDAQIARVLGVHRSTIGREIRRNAESREKYAAQFAHTESLNRQRAAGPFRNRFGSRSKLFNVQEKRNAFYPYLSKSHTAFFVPFNYLRLYTLPARLLYSGPMSAHIYSPSRLSVYRLSSLRRIEATGIILPYEKKSGEKVIFKPGQHKKKVNALEVGAPVKRSLKKARPVEEVFAERDWLYVPARIKYEVKKDSAVSEEAEKSATFLYLLLVHAIPYAYFLIIPSPTRPSCPFVFLILPTKSFQTLLLKNS